MKRKKQEEDNKLKVTDEVFAKHKKLIGQERRALLKE